MKPTAQQDDDDRLQGKGLQGSKSDNQTERTNDQQKVIVVVNSGNSAVIVKIQGVNNVQRKVKLVLQA
jgi:hypothetical protein